MFEIWQWVAAEVCGYVPINIDSKLWREESAAPWETTIWIGWQILSCQRVDKRTIVSHFLKESELPRRKNKAHIN